MVSCLIAWVVVSTFLSGSGGQGPEEKEEGKDGTGIKKEIEEEEPFDPTSMEDLSDTSRSFPTLGRQLPLHFSARKDGIKQEEEAAERVKMEQDRVMESTSIQPLGAEADDEEDEDEAVASWRDSGIGTSLEDTDRRRSVQKRRKALFSGDR